MKGFWQKLQKTLAMIKFEHTLFALPFAFLGAVLAANGLPTWPQVLWITLAMVGARSAAMTFNRIIDRDIDAKNPRTAGREIPSGKLSVGFAWVFLYISIGLFLLASYSLNWLTFALSPVALIVVLGYSYAKRFTVFAHLLLGLALAISPSAAWIAVRGTLNDELPILLSLLVLMWTAGFDVMYACQDFEYDRRSGLHSIPARFGIANSLWIARLFHLQAFIVLMIVYLVSGLGWLALAGVIAVGVLLLYQHTLVRSNDLSRMNAAFFTTNAFVSVILLLTFGGAVFMAR
ncbi:MAG TPA: UbiA-like polyprenyltransferase [Pyrinomonadaceae bacterium]|nr:UbiA family prenyltransferase [Chloracidobacterium sp.]MBP9937010.1 putative 4-hydroxybenzoate polyprenyltransferase [Pyrinomonadaceae bacterium]MBK7802048.1 UbiA family prenyltransferase [Chloracidobacterium sp.]MBK9765778.1 UbiA family prenyltransferase [Chloracidobacterium sp.]MBL0239597.1 UbiA family prenyltransferase [Chloracidobacterium sp.]